MYYLPEVDMSVVQDIAVEAGEGNREAIALSFGLAGLDLPVEEVAALLGESVRVLEPNTDAVADKVVDARVRFRLGETDVEWTTSSVTGLSGRSSSKGSEDCEDGGDLHVEQSERRGEDEAEG